MRAVDHLQGLRWVVVLILTTAAAFVAACDPCSTTFRCAQPPTVTLIGQLVDDSTGRPVRDAAIEVRYVSGVSFTPPVLTTRSRADGSFEFSAAAADVGQSGVRITVAEQGERPYIVPNFFIESSRVGGSATVLPPWVGSRPSLPVAIIVQDQAGNAIPAVTIQFQRASGPHLFSTEGPVDVVGGSTDGGYIFLFGATYTDTVGVVAGTLFVHYTGKDTAVAASFSSTPLFHLRHSVIVVTSPAP